VIENRNRVSPPSPPSPRSPGRLLPYPAPRIASTSSAQVGSPNDLIWELTEHADRYTGDQHITLYAVPSMIRTCIDRIRVRVIRGAHKPSVSLALSAAIGCGIEDLLASDDVQALLHLKNRVDLLGEDGSPGAQYLNEVSGVLRHFPLSITDTSMASERKTHLMMSQGIKLIVGNLANDLGTSFSSLCVLAAMIALADQPCTLSTHREALMNTVEDFYLRVRVRRRLVEALVETLGPQTE
jgi:hypothetical protein